MAETKKTEAAAAAAPPEAACLTLRQKLVEMRKACPEIVKKQHSDGVSYKYAKIYDVWEKITPIMNELGVDFDVISEQATRHAENGDPVYWITMQTKTRNGDKLMFLYEADLTIRWLNLDNDDETIEATVHAVGWNDDPAKAKGAAHTYALKYYLFEKFTVDQGEDDPDNSDFGAQGKGSGAGGRQQATQGRQGQGSGRLSDAQLARLYKKAEAAGMTKERTNARIVEKYKKQDPATLTRQEYDEICTSLDNAAAQHNQQGGNAYWVMTADSSIVDARAVSEKETVSETLAVYDGKAFKGGGTLLTDTLVVKAHGQSAAAVKDTDYTVDYTDGLLTITLKGSLSAAESVDIIITRTLEGCVKIVPLLEGGGIPDAAMLTKVLDVVNAKDIRPLTDKVSAVPPEVETYDIEIVYYTTPKNEAEVIANVEGTGGAIDRYNEWQVAALGRDINPDQLRKRILSPSWGENLTGAFRVDVVKPTYKALDDTQVAKFSGHLTVSHKVESEVV